MADETGGTTGIVVFTLWYIFIAINYYMGWLPVKPPEPEKPGKGKGKGEDKEKEKEKEKAPLPKKPPN